VAILIGGVEFGYGGASESQPWGKFPLETFIVLVLGNDGEKL
jgi:hypothetical protein